MLPFGLHVVASLRTPLSHSARVFRAWYHPTSSRAMPATVTPWGPNKYPHARRSGHVDVYKSESKGEVRVPDPYEWLEHYTEETEQWINAQVNFTRHYLDQNPERQALEDGIRKTMDHAKFSSPSLKDDGRWYWYYNSGLAAQSRIYRSKNKTLPDYSQKDAPAEEVFFDPNLLSEDGVTALSTSAFSRSGEYFAYGISRGSDVYTAYIRRTDAPLVVAEDGTRPSHDDSRLPDVINSVKFSSLVWSPDSKGLFYQRFPDNKADVNGITTAGDENATVFYHRLGTKQSDDIVVLKDDTHPTWMWGVKVSDIDQRYLIVDIAKDSSRKGLVWIADLQNNMIGENMQWDKLVNEFEADYAYVANDGTNFFFITNKDAPQYKLVSIDIADPPQKRAFKDVIPEDKHALLQDVHATNNDYFVVIYKRNVIDEIYLYSTKGERLTRVAKDFVGTATVAGRRDQPWFFVSLTGFTTPGIIARYDFNVKDEAKRWGIYRTILVNGLDPEEFKAEQVWYESKDGTKIPMFLVRHKDTPTDGTAPAVQYGYGGFSITISPSFSPAILTFVKMYGAVYAVPSIRGGSEFGEEWHLAGTKERKANCFDDFIAATQYLVDNKIAAPGKVALNGGSNGGLLVAACVNRAPEGLIGAAVAEVGVHDLLKFADFTIGKAWTSDYGNPHDPHDFDFIHPISPLHNVPTDKVLPPTFLLTSAQDDRVVPLHTFKLAATLQHLLPHNPNPLLTRIQQDAGHGAGKSTDQRIIEAADKWGFVAQSLGLKVRST